jgi:hypothetical protein
MDDQIKYRWGGPVSVDIDFYIPSPNEPLRSIAANAILSVMKAEDALDERKGLGP